MMKKNKNNFLGILNDPVLDSSDRYVFGGKKKKKIKKKTKLYAIFFSFIPLLIIFIFYSLFAGANLLKIYPTSCLGSWDNPKLITGQPSLNHDSSFEEFNNNNSAFFDGTSGRQMFCGGFKTEDNSDKIFKKAVLKFSWVMAEELILLPIPVLEQTEFEDKILDLYEDVEIIVVPDEPESDVSSESENVDSSLDTEDVETLIEVTPEPETTPEFEPTPERTPVPEPERTPESTPEPTPEQTPEITPTLEITPEVLPEETPSEEEPAEEEVENPDEAPTSFFNIKNLKSFSTILTVIASPSNENSPSPEPSPELTPENGDIEESTEESSPDGFSDDSSDNKASPSLAPTPELPTIEDVEASLSPTPIIPEISEKSSVSEPLTEKSEIPESTPSSSEDFEKKKEPIPQSLDDFFEILYSLDGKSWNLLGNIGKDNFNNLTLVLPIESWEDINSLQVSINTLPFAGKLPQVFLDAVWVEAEYEELDPNVEVADTEIDIEIRDLTAQIASGSFLDKFISKKSKNLQLDDKIIDEIKEKYINLEGKFVYFLGDVNGDNNTDFALAEEEENGTNLVKIFSGLNNKPFIVYTLEGLYPGIATTLGDVNNDGFSDYAILDPGYSTGEGGAIFNERGKIIAYSGNDRSVLWTYTGITDYQFQSGNTEIQLSGGDYDKDGKYDLVVGVPGIKPYGALFIISSKNGNVIKEIQGEEDSGGIGFAFAIGPDLDKDGFGEIVISEKYKNIDGFISAGQIRIISGSNFSTKYETKGNPQNYGFFGIFVSFIDDFNNDGIEDILVKSSEREKDIKGAIYILSSTDGSTIFRFSNKEFYEEFRNVFLIR